MALVDQPLPDAQVPQIRCIATLQTHDAAIYLDTMSCEVRVVLARDRYLIGLEAAFERGSTIEDFTRAHPETEIPRSTP